MMKQKGNQQTKNTTNHIDGFNVEHEIVIYFGCVCVCTQYDYYYRNASQMDSISYIILSIDTRRMYSYDIVQKTITEYEVELVKVCT